MKKATKLEDDVRDQLRAAWGDDGHGLKWIEAARGGTVGIPDVLLPLASGYSLPVELKCWKYWNAQCYCVVRREQIAFHKEAFRDGMKTAFIIGLRTDLVELYAFPGHLVPLRASWNAIPFKRMKQLPVGRDAIASLFASPEFWAL